MVIGGSKKKGKLFFPSVEGTWTNNHGHEVSSHLFLLPSGTERSQLKLNVRGKKGSITYSYPKKMLTTKLVRQSQNLEESHSKVAAFKRIFKNIFKNLDRGETTKTDTVEFDFDFAVNPRPIHFDINYYRKRTDSRRRTHILYVLEIDFES